MQTTLITRHNKTVVLEPHEGNVAGVPYAIDITIDGNKHRNAAQIVSSYGGHVWSLREIKGFCTRYSTIEFGEGYTAEQCYNQLVEHLRNGN